MIPDWFKPFVKECYRDGKAFVIIVDSPAFVGKVVVEIEKAWGVVEGALRDICSKYKYNRHEWRSENPDL